LSLVPTCIGIFNEISNPLFFVANVTAITTFLYIAFNWYFSSDIEPSTVIKKTAKAGFIYLSIFALFSMFGGVGTAVLLPMFLSLGLFCGVFFFYSKFSTNKTAGSNFENGS
jgi:hypothetical protein